MSTEKPVHYLPKNSGLALPSNIYSLPEIITRDLPSGFLEGTMARMIARGERKKDINPSILSVVCHDTLANSGSLDKYTLMIISTIKYYQYQTWMALFRAEERMKLTRTLRI